MILKVEGAWRFYVAAHAAKSNGRIAVCSREFAKPLKKHCLWAMPCQKHPKAGPFGFWWAKTAKNSKTSAGACCPLWMPCHLAVACRSTLRTCPPKAKKGKRLFPPPKHFCYWFGVFPHQIAQFLASFGQQPPCSVINQRTNLGKSSDNGHKGTTGVLQLQHRRLELCKHLNLENSPFCRVRCLMNINRVKVHSFWFIIFLVY